MSLIKKEATEKNIYKIEFSVEKDVFAAAVDKAYRKNVKNMNVPGFRKGKAPKHVIEAMYGKGVFYEDAINDCLPDAFDAAIKEAGLEIVGRPEFEIVSVEEYPILSAKVAVKPEVEIKDYKGIAVEKSVKEATDADVDDEINRTRERNARTIEITDRAAQLGDTANIDYEGFCDGVAFDGGKGEKHDLKLGAGQFIPGFEEQVAGKNIGDEFDVNVTFPAEYHAKELAGKPAVFKCKLNAIKATELPALDDDFAVDVSEFNTLDEYKADVKAKIQEKNDKAADYEVENKLADALIEKLVADIPEAMFAAETENYVRDYDSRLRMQGLDLSQYFKYTGMTLDTLREQLRPQAEKQVKIRLALEKIAELENVQVSDADIDAEYQRIADAYNTPLDDVKKMVAREDIAADLKVKGAMDVVKASAVITTVKIGEESKKTPAKKTATKKTTDKADDAVKTEKKTTAKKTATKKTADKADDAAKTEE
ncbi:MAG: trigger factor [Eubacteriales bacterium]|nr:trigger factor [Eubacteriales bacterium]